MTIDKEKLDQVFNYIITFVEKNPNLRIELVDELDHYVARFNLESTGATIWRKRNSPKNPGMGDLQKLKVNSDTGLPFKTIEFRTGDSAPALADIHFENDRFTINFVEGYDERVVQFCEVLNEIINRPQETMKIEKDYQEVLAKLKNGLTRISPEKQEIILQTQKMIEQVENLKREGQTPVSQLTESLRNTYALLQGKMTPENYQTYATKVEESPSMGMKILGGIMIALGVLIAAAGVVLAATGVGIAAGIATGVAGVAVSAIGIGIFSRKKESPSAPEDKDNTEVPSPK